MSFGQFDAFLNDTNHFAKMVNYLIKFLSVFLKKFINICAYLLKNSLNMRNLPSL